MLRFAPAHGWPRAAFALEYRRRPLRAANDNRCDSGADDTLAAALRLFAANGLSAAARAAQLSLNADAAGDPLAAGRWAEVCRTLDRSEARRLASRRRHPGHGNGLSTAR